MMAPPSQGYGLPQVLPARKRKLTSPFGTDVPYGSTDLDAMDAPLEDTRARIRSTNRRMAGQKKALALAELRVGGPRPRRDGARV